MALSNGDKIALGVSISTFAASVVYAIFGKKIHQTLVEEKSRTPITLTRSMSADGISSASIKVPMTTKSYYNDDQAKANKIVMDKIYAKYKTIIDTVAQINKIPPQLIVAIIFLESGGNETVNTGAVGLMQIGANGMTDTITMERKKGNLTESEKVILKRNLSASKYAKVMNAKQGDSFLTNAECLKPELNILLGTMLFMMIYDREEKKTSQSRLDRTIIGYNRGFYAKIPDGDTNSLIANSKLPSVTRSYITKFVGKKGALDVLV